MKFTLTAGLILGFWLLTACGGGSGNPTEIKEPQKPPPPREEVLELEWDQLACQKTSSCRNSVLNHSKDQMVRFFETHFSEPLNEEDANIAFFKCGRKSAEAWLEFFGPSAGDEDDFIAEMILMPSCIYQPEILEKLNAYLNKNKE